MLINYVSERKLSIGNWKYQTYRKLQSNFRFISDGWVNSKGFQIEYSSQDSGLRD